MVREVPACTVPQAQVKTRRLLPSWTAAFGQGSGARIVERRLQRRLVNAFHVHSVIDELIHRS